MRWLLFSKFLVSLLLVISTVGLAYVSGQLTIGGINTNKTINLLPPSIPVGTGGSGGNVSSVSSSNGYISASPTTGDVVLTFDGVSLNNTISKYGVAAGFNASTTDNINGTYNHTNVILYSNQTFIGKTGFNATAGNTPITISGSQAGGIMDKYLRIYDGSTEIFWLGKAVFGTYSGIVQPNPAGNIFFGVLSDNLGYIGSGLIVQPTSVGINRVTGSTIDFAENLTNFAGFDGNKNLYVNHNISAYEVDVYYLNVSTNATIPHFNINSTLALSTNYTNRNDKVIRIDLSIVSATTALSTDQAEIKVVLNDFDVLTPKNVIMCGTRSANRLAQSIDYHCVIDIPARFNYTIYPAVANGGTVQLSEVHIVDE